MAMPPDLQADCEAAQKAAEAFSFDEDKFEKEMEASDTITLVIRGHLHLEHVLIQMVMEALPNPSELELRRLPFPTKLDLAIALGLLPPDWRASVRRINEMRNKVAHRLEFEFTEKDHAELLAMLPAGLEKEVLYHQAKKPPEPGKTNWAPMFTIVPIFLDMVRQNLKKGRIEGHYINMYLERTLERHRRREAERMPKG